MQSLEHFASAARHRCHTQAEGRGSPAHHCCHPEAAGRGTPLDSCGVLRPLRGLRMTARGDTSCETPPEATLRSVLETDGPALEAVARGLVGDHADEVHAVIDSVCLNVLVGVLALPVDHEAAARVLLVEIHRVVALTYPPAWPSEIVIANDNGQIRAA